jgi:hypothetical protein
VRRGARWLQWPEAVEIKVFRFEKGNGGVDASIWERKGSGPNDACPSMKRRWPVAVYRWRAAGIMSSGGCCSKKKRTKMYFSDYAFGHDKRRTP